MLRIEGDLDRPALRRALAETVARHEILRTAFRLPAGLTLPLQVILEPGPVILPEVDLQCLAPEHRTAAASELLSALGRPRFSLESGEVWRAALLQLGSREHRLLLAISAACADAEAFKPLAADLLAAYTCTRTGERESSEPPFQYADVAEWQNSLLEEDDTAKAVEAWREHWRRHDLDAQLAPLLPLEERVAAPGSFAPQETAVPLDGDIAESLATLAHLWGTTQSILVLTAWKAMIQRGTGRDETLVGVLYPGRDAEELETVVGPLARYLPSIAHFDPAASLREAVAQVQEVDAEARRRGEYFSWDHVAEHGRGPGGFSVCFEAAANGWELAAGGLRITPVRLSWTSTVLDKFSLALSCEGAGVSLRLALRYDPRLFRREAVCHLAGRLAALLGSIAAQPEAALADHPAMAQAELGRWLELSVTPPVTDRSREGKTLAAVFEEQVDRAPDRLAVVAGDSRLTFRDLDIRANRLAHYLRAAGAGPEVPVALCLERSAEAVAAILAVWKAGAFYVPLDPTQPAERLAYLLEDTAAPVLVTDSQLASGLPGEGYLSGVRTLRLDEEAAAIALQPVDRLAGEACPRSLAYTIYTSGSTGRPKGVQVEHHSALHLLAALESAVLGPLAESGLLSDPLLASLNAPMIFDASVQQLALLLAGHALCIVPQDIRADGAALLAFLREEKVDLLDCTPSQLRLLVNAGLLDGPADPRFVLTAGEAVDEPLWSRLAQAERTVCFNLYGPTECSVDATFHRIEPGSTNPTIGRPLPGYEVFLLDRTLQPVPPGAPGELCLGGAGLARGYLRRPDLTAERFAPHSFARRPGERLYRTGDIGRHLPNGDLEFLGRLDHQVKIRGFRIELGEIEAVLAAVPGVREAAVVVRGEGERRRLVAYVAGDGCAAEKLRRMLAERLPAYMVPAAWVELAVLPRLASGKIDRRRLPEPEVAAESAFEPPRDEVESLLARIWAEVLGAARVGIHDNFFTLGGDSILSIQVVARANQAGCLITARQLFEHQTVAELAAVASHGLRAEAEQAAVTGDLPLTPIQRWFLDGAPLDPHHFNQSVLLQLRRPLAPATAERAFAALALHHDALRLRFRQDGDGWRAWNAGIEGAAFLRADLTALPPERGHAALAAAVAQAQEGCDLGAGPLARALWLDLPAGEARLLLTVHHLAVDGVSWRVLLGDLETACHQLGRGETVRLPAKTTAFRDWAVALAEHARTLEPGAELAWWLREGMGGAGCAPADHPAGADTQASVRVVTVELTTEETQALLHGVPAAYRTRIDDVLLAALARTLAGRDGALRVDLEGHGREEILPGIDLSRTVGWFTTLFPVRLVLPPGDDLGRVLCAVKEHLRALPQRGIGYGLLRHLHGGEAAAELAAQPPAEISFNYLGQLDQVFPEDSVFAPAAEASGPARSPRALRPHTLAIGGFIAGGRLRLDWGYSANRYERPTVERWAAGFLEQLRTLIAHCLSPEAGRYTPSDFPLAGLDQGALDQAFAGVHDLDDLYPLSPLQEGILFHHLYEPGSGVYVEQLVCTLRGELDEAAFAAAWQRLVERHPMLRTAFCWQGLDRPLQAVHTKVEIAVAHEDWCCLTPREQEARLAALVAADRERGFDLAQPLAMRWALIRTAAQEHRFLWSHHHILLDGWSFAALISELLAIYQAFREGSEPRLPQRRPYREYIDWLRRRDHTEAEAYWRRTLAGWSAPTPLVVDRQEAAASGRGLVASAGSAALEERARGLQLTPNTLVQAAWGLLLARYGGRSDVVFGATVSGRSGELPGIESMVGLFINTLPVRLEVAAETAVLPWLRGAQQRQAERSLYEHSPLVEVQRWSEVPRGLPLFESILVFENYPRDTSMRQGGASLGVTEVRALEQTNYPLTVSAVPGPELALRLDYDRSRFDDVTATRMLGHFRALVDGLLAAGEDEAVRPLADLSLLAAAERHQLLAEWNDSAAVDPVADAFPARFAAQVERTPEAPAVVVAGEALTYRELDRRAARLARRLRGLGVGPEVLVGLCLERSLDLAVGILAIFKAGGAFLPLEPTYPQERLAYLLADSGAGVLIAESPRAAGLPLDGVRVLSPRVEEEEEGEPAGESWPAVRPESLAYVIYTSGSTGRPKAVEVEHGNLANLLFAGQRELGWQSGDVMPCLAPFSFDIFLFELLSPWLAGGTAVLVPLYPLLDLGGLLDLLSGVTRLHAVPALMRQIVDAVQAAGPDAGSCLPLRTLLTGGDAVPAALLTDLRAVFPQAEVRVLYGPTEGTILAASYRLPAAGEVRSLLGRPLANVEFLLCGPDGRPVPIGVPGELWIGGAGVTRGYLRREELTAERFPTVAGRRFYRTGDLARSHGDGNLEFLGRIDDQVKIRGFRIEPGEIEAELCRHPAVREAVVLAREAAGGDRRLVAWVLTRPEEPGRGGDLGPAPLDLELREFLSGRLPAYMVPAAFLCLESFPWTANGKIDRQALPEPEAVRPETAYVAPRTPTEETIAAIWSDLLGVRPVGVFDDFFGLGGHSLIATRIISRVRKSFEIQLPIRDLFIHPTVAGLAERVEEAILASSEDDRLDELLDLLESMGDDDDAEDVEAAAEESVFDELSTISLDGGAEESME
jgi:amino acid adenylation domain-containing protein/non-ribosomal peptide synthase protein (TIGR01720 family)